MIPGSPLSRTLLFRADASVSIGTGHVMRCLALAQAWQDAGGRPVFAMAESTPGMVERLKAEGMHWVPIDEIPGSKRDAEATAALARSTAASWVAVDGDRFGVSFLLSLRSADFCILLLDDFAERESYPVDLLLNMNLDAREDQYRQRGTDSRLLLGTRYVLLRSEFRALNRDRQFPDAGQRVLVTLGGTDPDNLAPQVVRALDRSAEGGLQVTVVAGAGYPNLQLLREASSSRVRIVVNPGNMPEIIAGSDLAIIAAGGTLWELLYLGCAVLSYARNPVQARVIEGLERLGAVCNLGYAERFSDSVLWGAVETISGSKQRREEMAARGYEVVDGQGVHRVMRAMLGEQE